MANKSEKFKNAVIKFKNSKQTSDDYFSFVVSAIMVTRQGDGLIYEQLETILKEVIDEEK